MDRLWLGLGGLFGLTGVIMAALAAHALPGRLTPTALSLVQTAIAMQTGSQTRHESRVGDLIRGVKVFEIKLPAYVMLAVRDISEGVYGALLRLKAVEQAMCRRAVES